MVGLEHQVQLLNAQVQRLRFENTSLVSQNDLLSKVLVMKEGQVKLLRHESKVTNPATQVYCSQSCMRRCGVMIIDPRLASRSR